MTRQALNYGSYADDPSADYLFATFGKVEANFVELYAVTSSTINAGAAAYAAGVGKEGKIQLAINAAVSLAAARVFVPASMLPYDTTLVTFSTGVQMVREGGSYDVYDVFAYGARGDGTGDDSYAINAAGAAANASGGGIVFLPEATFIILTHPHPDNITLTVGVIAYAKTTLQGAGVDATVLKLGAVQDGNVVWNRNIGSYLDTNIVFRDLTVDGNAINQTNAANVGIGLHRARDCRFDSVVCKNIRGTTASGAGEGIGFNLNLSADVVFSRCSALQTSGSTSSGFGANGCINVSYSQCLGRNMTLGAGFTHNDCREVTYVNCDTYLNPTGFNSEVSEGVYYSACTAGGRSISSAALSPFTAGQSLGNTNYGFVINGTTKWAITGGSSARYNSQGIYVADTSTKGIIDDVDISDNGAYGLNIHPNAVTTTWVGTTLNTGNGTAAMQIPGTIGNSVIDAPHIVSPAMPASTVAYTNPFPFRVAVTLSGGTVTGANISTAALTCTQGTFILNPGWTIAITYSVAPAWLWTKA